MIASMFCNCYYYIETRLYPLQGSKVGEEFSLTSPLDSYGIVTAKLVNRANKIHTLNFFKIFI